MESVWFKPFVGSSLHFEEGAFPPRPFPYQRPMERQHSSLGRKVLNDYLSVLAKEGTYKPSLVIKSTEEYRKWFSGVVLAYDSQNPLLLNLRYGEPVVPPHVNYYRLCDNNYSLSETLPFWVKGSHTNLSHSHEVRFKIRTSPVSDEPTSDTSQ